MKIYLQALRKYIAIFVVFVKRLQIKQAYAQKICTVSQETLDLICQA